MVSYNEPGRPPLETDLYLQQKNIAVSVRGSTGTGTYPSQRCAFQCLLWHSICIHVIYVSLNLLYIYSQLWQWPNELNNSIDHAISNYTHFFSPHSLLISLFLFVSLYYIITLVFHLISLPLHPIRFWGYLSLISSEY